MPKDLEALLKGLELLLKALEALLKGSLQRQMWLAPTICNGDDGASAIVLHR